MSAAKPSRELNTAQAGGGESFLRKWLGRLAGVAFGSVATMVTPFWPTEPTIDPAYQSLGAPMDVPFAIANASKAFALADLKISCELIELRTSIGVRISQLLVAVDSRSELGRAEQALYVCPFSKSLRLAPSDHVVQATIRFHYTYRQSLFGSETEMGSRKSPEFRLLTTVTPNVWERRRELR